MELHQRIAVAIKQGRAQLQRVTYNPKGSATIEELSQWRPVPMVKPSLAMLMFHVRAANAYAQNNVQDKANDALKHAHKAFQ